ncbi:Uncharacterised protein [Vibrio cholerae]|nr:Uncharacterised protein [Vibrio cholerae]
MFADLNGIAAINKNRCAGEGNDGGSRGTCKPS